MSTLKTIEPLILTLRGQKVILDADLAEAYGVQTRRLNEQVKRNADRFPEDFMFQLTEAEWGNLKSQFATSSSETSGSLRSQIVTLNTEEPENKGVGLSRSQIVTTSEGAGLRSQIATLKRGRGQHRKYMPYVFTEHGALMAASVLNSPKAVEMSVFVVRAFVKMREQLAANAEILKRLAEIDKTLLEHNDALQVIWEQLQPLLVPPDPPKKGRIGFNAHVDSE